MQKRIPAVLSLAVLAAGSGGASAGEWTGAYIGIGGGYGAAVHELSFSNGPAIPAPPAFGVSLDGLGGDGGFFTLGVGADYQVNSNFVVGAFFDYDWTSLETDIGGSLALGGDSGSANLSLEVEDQWSIGGRAGYLVTPSTLLFLTAGYTDVDVSDLTLRLTIGDVSDGGVVAGIGSFSGYFLGGGAEVKLTEAVSLKAEYRYTDLDAERISLLPGSGIDEFVTTKLDPDIQTARVTLNYRFGAGDRSEPETQVAEAAAPASWTGFYLGVGGGYAFANNELSLSDGPAIPDDVAFNVGIDGLGGQGGAFTVGGGADYQFAPKFVIGAFVDYTRHNASTDLNASITDVFGFDSLGANVGFDIEDEISVGARLGYLANSRTLLYGTVGYSAVDISDAKVSVSIDGVPLFNEVLARNGDFSGYFLGAGIETKLSDAVSLKLDYRYTDLGSERVTLLPDVFPEANEFVTTSLDTDIQTVRLTLNYRFDAVREAAAPLK